MTIEVDKITFDEHITKPCVVDFYTSGCPSCEKLSPVFEELSRQCNGLSFLKVNLDEDITLAEQYEINHVPTLILFKDSKPINISTGYLDLEGLSSFISGDKEGLQ